MISTIAGIGAQSWLRSSSAFNGSLCGNGWTRPGLGLADPVPASLFFGYRVPVLNRLGADKEPDSGTVEAINNKALTRVEMARRYWKTYSRITHNSPIEKLRRQFREDRIPFYASKTAFPLNSNAC